MKKWPWQLSIMLFPVLFFLACGEDDCPNCSQNDGTGRIYIEASDYISRQYFDLTRSDSLLSLADLAPGDSITYVELYFVSRLVPLTGIPAVAAIDPFDTTRYRHETVVGTAHKLDSDWDVQFFYHRMRHYVVLEKPLHQDLNLGAYIEYLRRVPGKADTIISVGKKPLNDTDTLLLKLISRDATTPEDVTWNYMWRNVYDVGPVEDPDGFNLRVFLKSGPVWKTDINNDHEYQGAQKFLSLLQMDLDNDGRVDAYSSNILERERGHLRFPDRQPFISPALVAQDSIVYYPPMFWPSETRGKYYLVVERTPRNQ